MKPRNFCAAHSPVSKAAGSWQQRLQVYVIDLEGSTGIPDEEQAGWEDEFFGTVDYAGSTALLQCMAGPSDDMESLCYRCMRTCAAIAYFCMARMTACCCDCKTRRGDYMQHSPHYTL